MSAQMQRQDRPIATVGRTTPDRPPLLLDIYRGAVHGDYARQLGVAGYLTQALFGFIPVLGQLCALRDLFASIGKRDGYGIVLNFLALVPVLGGFPKTLRILIHTMRLMSNIRESLRTS